MLELTDKGLENRKAFEDAGYRLPSYDRKAMIEETKKNPTWVHFGAGNIFRAFHAALSQKLLEEGVSKTGIIVAEGYDYEIVEKQYRPHDNLSVLVTLKSNGSIEKDVIGSIAESCILDSARPAEFGRLKEIFESKSLQLCTFTVTEKGYAIADGKGQILPAVEADFKAGPAAPVSYIGKVVSLLYARYQAGKLPIAMVSTDNCSHNGQKLYDAVIAYAKAWAENGKADEGFVDYLNDPAKVSFPWSMIDKITPRPDASVQEILKKDGLEGVDPVVTSKKTWIAPFVNAEETQYLVIEDAFPNGRPALEKAGVLFTDRETVNKVERMKVTTCLNPLHTLLAVYGCLLGYTKISDEMKDQDLKAMAERLGYQEGLPVVVNPGVLDPKEFLDTVVNVRIPNPFLPDTPQRIATDTSQKLAIRFGETVKAYEKDPALSVSSLRMVPLVQAGWLRYLMAVDDNGEGFMPSPDPLLEKAQEVVKPIHLGDHLTKEQALETMKPLLTNDRIFGVDLVKAGLADRVVTYFVSEIEGKGAVRRTIEAALKED